MRGVDSRESIQWIHGRGEILSEQGTTDCSLLLVSESLQRVKVYIDTMTLSGSDFGGLIQGWKG